MFFIFAICSVYTIVVICSAYTSSGIIMAQQPQSHCGQERIITIDEESCLCKIEDRILKKPTALLYQYCLYISIRISFLHRKRCGCFFIQVAWPTYPQTERRLYQWAKLDICNGWYEDEYRPTSQPIHNRRFMDNSKHF